MSLAVTHRVGDLCEQIRGVTYSKEEAVLTAKPGFKPVLRANNITEHGLIFDDLVYVPADRVSSRQFLKANDVIIAASSGSIDVVGKAARAIADFDGGFGAFCKVLRPNGNVDPGYFAHFFQTQDYRRRVSVLAAGANINNLRNEHIDGLEVALPPLAEQRRIAAILDKADALRAKRREAIAKLDQLRQAVFFDMFGNPLENQSSWPTRTIGELATFITSGSRGWAKYYAERGSKFVRIQNLVNGELDLSDCAFVDAPPSAEARRTRVLEGDVLLSITADLGRTAVVPKGIGDAHVNQHIAILRLADVNPSYVSHFLAGIGGRVQIDRLNRDAVKAGLNFSDIRALKIPIPPAVSQQEYVSKLGEIQGLERCLEVQQSRIEDLFVSLQQQSFAGTV